MRITYKLIIIVSFFQYNVMAQKGTNSLSVGDILPDVTIDKIINSKNSNIKISAFKDRLLIIDFWSTNCSGCIEALPKFDVLQNHFGDLIKILPVTTEARLLAANFWKKNKYTKNLNLSSVVEDQVLSAYFPHKSIPHEVWIYKGKVVGITSSDYVDTYHINQVLNNENINWPLKYDFYSFDGAKQTLFTLDTNQVDTNFKTIKYAAISDYKEKVNSEGFSGGFGIVRDKKNKTVRTWFLNQPIYISYILNWQNIVHMDSLTKPSYSVDPNQVLWEVADKSKYRYEKKAGYAQDWIKIHGICFESMNPDTGQTDVMVYKTIINDLDRLLGLKVRWEKRKEKILKLVVTSKSNLLAKHNSAKKELLQNLVYELNQQENNPYVFDETKYTESVDIDFNFSSWTDIRTIRNAIKPYGLDLVEEQRVVDKLIFSEIDGGFVLDRKMMADAQLRKIASMKNVKTINLSDGKSFLENNKNKSGIVVTPSGLQYKVLKQGTGVIPKANDKVSIQFTSMLINGQIFQSSFETGKAFITKISDAIPGWKEALSMMHVGSKWILYVPADLAYGQHSLRGTIPPNSPVIFEFELLQITN